MAYTTQIIPDHRLGVGILYGAVDVDDFTESLDALYTANDWDPTFDALWDCREVTSLVLDPEDAEAILAQMNRLQSQFDTGRAAFVVPRMVDYLIARMLVGKLDLPKRQHGIFRRLAPALEWLQAEDLSPVIQHHTANVQAD